MLGSSVLSPKKSDAGEQRDLMKSYWASEHGEPTLENMMLDSNAAAMDVLERPEILSELPSLTGRKVLELGSGIGRFSNSLAQKASHVIAVDFVEASCDTNRRHNHFLVNEGKLEVLCEDATKLNFEPNSFDVVFSNWLLMYLGDKEVENMAQMMLMWLRPRGKLFFRESCFHRSGNASRSFNPTQYRHPKQYFDMFHSARSHDGSRFNLVRTSCVDTYVKVKDNPNQLWWIWEKCDPVASTRMSEFLDRHQYHYHNVLRYEKLFGKGFISVGGNSILDAFAKELKLTSGASPLRVLDVGCGIGGSAVHLAQKYGSFVHGIDISGVMTSIMAERLRDVEQSVRARISFGTGDMFEKEFVTNSFDVIICRDFLMQFHGMDKRVAVTKFKNWLAPGGTLFICDYTKGERFDEGDKPEFDEYIGARGYSLVDVEEEKQLLESSGFQNVQAIDRTATFVDELRSQLLSFVESVDKEEGIRSAVNQLDPDTVFAAFRSALRDNAQVNDTLRLLEGAKDECLELAAEGAVERIIQFFECQRSGAELAQVDLSWVKKYWNIKINYAANNTFGWTVFLANKKVL